MTIQLKAICLCPPCRHCPTVTVAFSAAVSRSSRSSASRSTSPHVVRRLVLETEEMQQATDSPPPRSPSRESTANTVTVGEEAPVPASPVVYCSQYRTQEYERPNGPLPGNEKVGEWLCNMETAYWSKGLAAPSPLNAALSLNGLDSMLPAAPCKDD
jgi:hypothetical protein